VLTGGEDVQFNHAIGIFRDEDDTSADTEKSDLQEGYLSYRIPVGAGLTLKGGRLVTLLGYEVIESPNNLNFSRSFLFSFAIPLTHVGLLAFYLLTDTLSMTRARSSAGTWRRGATRRRPGWGRSPSRASRT
jgi:Putative beta-barrel porin-2, OmpL-like. bbp2